MRIYEVRIGVLALADMAELRKFLDAMLSGGSQSGFA